MFARTIQSAFPDNSLSLAVATLKAGLQRPDHLKSTGLGVSTYAKALTQLLVTNLMRWSVVASRNPFSKRVLSIIARTRNELAWVQREFPEDYQAMAKMQDERMSQYQDQGQGQGYPSGPGGGMGGEQGEPPRGMGGPSGGMGGGPDGEMGGPGGDGFTGGRGSDLGGMGGAPKSYGGPPQRIRSTEPGLGQGPMGLGPTNYRMRGNLHRGNPGRPEAAPGQSATGQAPLMGGHGGGFERDSDRDGLDMNDDDRPNDDNNDDDDGDDDDYYDGF